jgi:hypothetical protein
MTAHDGFPRDMEPFALDSSTAEGLVTGVVDAGDAPPEYRAVARTLHALREAPDGPELFGEPAAVERIATAIVLDRSARPQRHASGFSSRAARLAAAVVIAGGIFLSGGLASAGTLPEPAQDFVSAVLDKVGISVPAGGEDPTVVDAPPTTSSPLPPSSGAPGPDVATPPDLPSATAPGNGQGDVHGTKADETPPGTAKNHGNGKSPNGPPAADNGNGRGQ